MAVLTAAQISRLTGEFASAEQGQLAVSAAKTGDPVSQFVNDTQYLTPGQPNTLLTNTAGYTLPGSNVSQFVNDAGYLKPEIMVVQDQKTAGTAGGTFTAGAWRTRDLNTVVHNSITGASLASNQITLPAGTYRIDASAPVYRVGRHMVLLHDITGAATLLLGTSEFSAAGSNYAVTRSLISGVVSLAAESALELQHHCAVTRTDNGFGRESDFDTVEVYSQVTIQKIG